MIPSVNVTPIAPSAMIAPVKIPSAIACGITRAAVWRDSGGSSRPAAQKRLGHTRIVEQRASGSGEAIASFGQHVTAVRHAERGLRVLLDHQHRDALFSEGAVISARAIASICRSPPDSVRARSVRRDDSGGNTV